MNSAPMNVARLLTLQSMLKMRTPATTKRGLSSRVVQLRASCASCLRAAFAACCASSAAAISASTSSSGTRRSLWTGDDRGSSTTATTAMAGLHLWTSRSGPSRSRRGRRCRAEQNAGRATEQDTDRTAEDPEPQRTRRVDGRARSTGSARRQRGGLAAPRPDARPFLGACGPRGRRWRRRDLTYRVSRLLCWVTSMNTSPISGSSERRRASSSSIDLASPSTSSAADGWTLAARTASCGATWTA